MVKKNDGVSALMVGFVSAIPEDMSFLNHDVIGGLIGGADGGLTIGNCGWLAIRDCGGLIASQWGGCLEVTYE